MNDPIVPGCYYPNETAVINQSLSRVNIANSAIHADNQKQDIPISQTAPTSSIMVPGDNTFPTKPGKTMSEYIAQRCHSFRNLVTAATPQQSLPGVSLPPENLLNVAQQRLLSVVELNKMQDYIRQQTHITVNGKRLELETLPADTPLFYQFYCLNQKAYIDDESMRIFRNNCTIEKSRPAIILINNELINEKVTEQVRQLEKEFANVHVVDMSFLLDLYEVAGMSIKQARTRDNQFYLTVNGENCTLANEFLCDGTVRVYNSNADILDILQFVSMYHCNQICDAAGVKSSGGCLKIDLDMELKKPLGRLKCPNGFSAFVLDRVFRKSGASNNHLAHTLNVENSLVAVTRPRHTILAKSVCPHPRSIFCNFTIAVRKSFHQPVPLSAYDVEQVNLTGDETNLLKMLCKVEDREEIAGQIDTSEQLSIGFNTCSSWKQIVAIPLNDIKADQSRVRGVSSWQDKTSRS